MTKYFCAWGDCRANRYSKATTKSSRNSGKTKDKADKSADNFVADVISRDHANSSGEGIGNNCCFIVEQMVNIDNYLTSNYVASVHQNPTDGTYLCDAFNQAMEDCVALGIADDDILYNVESFNSQLNKQLSPILLMTVDTIQEHSCKRPLKALCDSGAAVTMINPSSIPTGAVPFKLQKPLRMMTGGGSIELKYGVKMKVIRFPELSPTRAFTDEVIAIINKHTGTHDVILGRDFLGAAGIVPNPATSLIQWDDLNCPWLPHDHFHGHNWTSAVRTAMEALAADPYLEYDSFSVQKGSKEILSSKYYFYVP
ncbi:hypothetical protein IV203_025645 [Nitzschia inconspicua]|uniref:Peptidase A2 domain-containing protein n=1 Tax=Nitzschia inconspicua TaxID=303405 RepID=A0A9K3PYN1_9STRA|nr:hypothetical protein IV203_025645 [Nitzschia inconspicua]